MHSGSTGVLSFSATSGVLMLLQGIMTPEADWLAVCHGSAGTPLGTHAGRQDSGLEDEGAAIRT
jgi:hypothetical protein